MANSILRVHLTSGNHLEKGPLIDKEFTDWFDFADYVKQENLAYKHVTIFHWVYVFGEADVPTTGDRYARRQIKSL